MFLRTRLSAILFAVTLALPIDAQSDQAVTEARLLELLKERDAVIIELQQSLRSALSRLERLEKQDGIPVASAPGPAPSTELQQPRTAASDRPSSTERTTDFGRIVVDELAAERALERTLSQAGALLLPTGRLEVTPTFGFAVNEYEFAGFAGIPDNLSLTKREVFNLDVEARLGLPFDSQLELGLPYTSVRETVTDITSIPPAETFDERGSGVGSLRVGLAKTFLRERGWRPDLIGRLTWNTGTGDRIDNEVFIGGFESIEASVVAIKRADPVVFVGNLSYETFSGEDGIDPGDVLSFSLGTALAVSPSASFSASISNQFFDKTRVDNARLSGSDFTSVVLNLGVSTIIARDVLLGVGTGIGVTADAPDYTVGISTTFRTSAFRGN